MVFNYQTASRMILGANAPSSVPRVILIRAPLVTPLDSNSWCDLAKSVCSARDSG